MCNPLHELSGERPTSSTDQLLKNADAYAATFDKGDLPIPPDRKVAIVACMDARINPYGILGLAEGDAHIIRNAGVITDDQIRSLAISQRLLGTEEIILIHDTDCGMLTFSDDEFREQIRVETGIKPPWVAEAFSDLDTDVRHSIARIEASPFIPVQDSGRGLVYDVHAGTLRQVKAGWVAGAARGSYPGARPSARVHTSRTVQGGLGKAWEKWPASQVLPSFSYGKLEPVALLVGRAEDIRPRQMPAPSIGFPRHSRSGIGVLVALPVVVFGVPAMFGHPVVPSDDLIQNYPLRVLVGSQLRHGQLPLFDPYIWSGAPLLGGWNAGAAYPLTWLFAVMSGPTAWTINLIVTWWVAGLGTFGFLRMSRLSPVASFLGGLSFAFAGAMTAQVAHFGFVAGMSWVPVALVAVLKLSERPELRARLAWVCALAGAWAMVILAGEPRAIDDAVVILAMYALWRAWRLGRRSARWRYIGYVSIGAVLGAAVGAVQWLPGIEAVHTSQRAMHTVALFDSGSLVPKWLLLSIVPNLFGGSGSFGQPTFFGQYSLSEITGYVGLLPLVAAFGLLGRLRRRQRVPEWLIWHLIAIVGVILALGGNTVLGPVLVHLPLFGDQRLQSRNIMIADFALSVLLAYWVDVWLRSPVSERGRLPSPRRFLGLVPPVAVVAIVAVTLAWGAGMLRWMGLAPSMANRAGPSAPWLVPFLGLALAAIALVMWGPRLVGRLRARAVVGFVVLDVGIFTVLTLVSVAPGLTRAPAPSEASPSASHVTVPTPPLVPVRSLVHGGRFAVYDPDELDSGELTELGVSDSNVLTDTPSVEGYSSIVDSTYAQVTGSHQATGEGQNVLDPQAISNGTLDQLDTTVLLTPSAYLVTTDTGSNGADSQVGRRQLAPRQLASWSLGAPLDVMSLTIPSSGQTVALSGVRVGVVGASGSTRWETPVALSGDGLGVPVTPTQTIVGVEIAAAGRSISVDAPVVTTVGGEIYRADGQLQDVLVPPHWRFQGFDGAFAVFDDTRARAGLSLEARSGSSTAGATIGVTGGPAWAPTRARVSSPHGVIVVRSGAAIPGWSATWRRSGTGAAQMLPVRLSGVVQAVTVPAGAGTLTWKYTAPGFGTALWLSGGALAALGALGATALLWRRRSRASYHGALVTAPPALAGRIRSTGRRGHVAAWRPTRAAPSLVDATAGTRGAEPSPEGTG